MISWQGRILKNFMVLKRRFSRQPGKLEVARERADTEALARLFKPLAPVECSPVMVNGVPAEWIVPPNAREDRVVLYLHGGSFNSGSIVSHRPLAGSVAFAGEARALILSYRLAPEHPFPAALEDSLAAYQWLLDSGVAPQQITVAGDSAGGTLALALLVHLRDQMKPLPAAAVLLSPVTDLMMVGESWQSNARKDVMLEAANIQESFELYLQGKDPRDPLASPLYADLCGLPPLLIQVGSEEVLLSDATRLAEKAKAAGVDVTLEVWEGMQHEWQFAASFLPEGRRAIQRIGKYIDTILSKDDMVTHV